MVDKIKHIFLVLVLQYCLNIDKYLVCETRDVISDGSGPYIIRLRLKIIVFTWS
jgi:hypothetical protein